MRDTFANNTIQFRMLQSSLDHEKVNNWTKLVLKFAESSRRRDFPKSFDTRRNLEYKTAKFLDWMILDPVLISFWENEMSNDRNDKYSKSMTPK